MTWNIGERRQVFRWVWGSLAGLFFLVVACEASRYFYPVGDSFGFIRQMFDVGGPALVRAITAVGVLLFVSMIEEGNWLEQIGGTQYGPTILLSVVLYSVLRG